MKTININGADYTIEELAIILKEAKQSNPMKEVYEYHNTTKAEFEEAYKNVPLTLKYLQIETMIVAFYNQGWKPDFSNTKEKRHYAWLDPWSLTLVHVSYNGNYLYAPIALLLQKEEYVQDMAKKFLPQLKDSRMSI